MSLTASWIITSSRSVKSKKTYERARFRIARDYIEKYRPVNFEHASGAMLCQLHNPRSILINPAALSRSPDIRELAFEAGKRWDGLLDVPDPPREAIQIIGGWEAHGR